VKKISVTNLIANLVMQASCLRLGAFASRVVGTPTRGENSTGKSNKIDSRKT
jgi:hypothetical protein